MGLHSAPGSLLFLLWALGICAGFVHENCTKRPAKRILSVPDEVAMLNSNRVFPKVFNHTAVPHNLTWHNSTTGQEISNQAGRILVKGETLWILKVLPDDAGKYETVLRTPLQCYRTVTELVVDLPAPGECGRPQKVDQSLTMGVTDNLVCPLMDYIKKLQSYNITASVQWFRGCDLIVDGAGRYSLIDATTLKIDRIQPRDGGSYTCTLNFTLGGVTGSTSETINARIAGKYTLAPQIHEPADETVKEQMGVNFTKRCLVFVECVGEPKVSIDWMVGGEIISKYTTNRVYSPKKSVLRRDPLHNGAWLERLLVISTLRQEDFHVNYTCRAFNPSGFHEAYFTLQPPDPDIILPIGLVFCGATALFIVSIVVYYVFKVDIVLWLRRAFPVLYTNNGSDGKLYDAYVAYPQPGDDGFSEEVEAFALHTLPEVLEKASGYKLFIAGRDCLPGSAVVDSVEENIQASRRLLLLYTASTFTGKKPTSDTKKMETESRGGSSVVNFDGSDGGSPDTRQQLECVAAMHRTLLEGSLKVVLVELEEVTPAQLALFPESVRHLRKRQGAVCWWKNRRTRPRWRNCSRRREDEDKDGPNAQLSPSLSPSSRFWKELRYRMPVRGKRAMGPMETALLNS